MALFICCVAYVRYFLNLDEMLVAFQGINLLLNLQVSLMFFCHSAVITSLQPLEKKKCILIFNIAVNRFAVASATTID
jgi:hypothetical protein